MLSIQIPYLATGPHLCGPVLVSLNNWIRQTLKVAFVGKGGAGKTTLSSLFSRYLASKQLPVLAVDADINQHMALTLGFSVA